MRRKFLLGLAFAIIAQVAAAFAQEPAIVHESNQSERIGLREPENGDLSQNVRLMNGDTIFVQRAEPRDTIIVPERFF